MQIYKLKDENGNPYTAAVAVDENGGKYLKRIDDKLVGMIGAKQPLSTNATNGEDIQQQFDQEDTTTKGRNALSESTGWLPRTVRKPFSLPILPKSVGDVIMPNFDYSTSRPMITAGQITDKIVNNSKNIKDFARSVLPTPNFTWDKSDPLQATYERNKQQEENDSVMKEYDAQKHMPDYIGGMLPYMAMDALAGPAFNKAAGKVIDTVGDTLHGVAEGTKSAAHIAAENAANSGMAGLEQLGQRGVDEWAIPAAIRKANKAQQVVRPNPYIAGIPQDILGGTALGAVEGAMTDNGADNGAIAGLMGSIVPHTRRVGIPGTKFPLSIPLPGGGIQASLVRAPNVETLGGQQLLKGMEKWGWIPTTAEKQGVPEAQAQIAGMGTHGDWASLEKFRQQNNQAAVNKHAFEAAGIPKGMVYEKDANGVMQLTKPSDKMSTYQMPPDAWSAHYANLKNQYDELQKGATGIFTQADIGSLNRHVTQLANNNNTISGPIARDAAKYLSRIQQGGGMLNGEYSLSHGAYQNLRADLKNDISDAWNSDNSVRAKALSPILDKVNESLEKGIVRNRGTTAAQQYKNLDEQMAMYHEITNNALTPTGDIDTKRLYNYLKTTDQGRYLTEKGGRVRNLHNVADAEAMSQLQADSGLSGTNMDSIGGGVSKMTPVESATRTPGQINPSPMTILLHKMITSGYPNTTGILGPLAMTGKDLGRPSLYTRSLGQSTQAWPEVGRDIKDAYNWTEDKVTHPGDTIKNAAAGLVQFYLDQLDAHDEKKNLKK